MKNKKAFTLVEVIISIAALSVICAVLLRLFIMAGDTNTQAKEKQTSQLCVVSSIEVLLSADSFAQGLDRLGLGTPGASDNGKLVFEQDGYTITIAYQEKEEGYPGTLYGITVSAHNADTLLAEIHTQKYYKEEQDG